MIDIVRLAKRLSEYDIYLTDEKLDKLEIYAQMLVEWNAKMNLTAITAAEDIENRHFLDSLLLTKHLKGNERLIDVGTGAGFPGMVLKIACPELDVCLLDSLDKRLVFLQAVANAVNAPCHLVHARAEDAGHFAELREKFDIATARAVAPLNVLCEICLPFVTAEGRFLAMKGSAAEDEIQASEAALASLMATVDRRFFASLPDGSERETIIIRKTGETPERYPRRAAAIKKRPL